MGELRLMKGNEVLAEAAVRCGCDGYFGYPITPQSEVMETLMELRPWETTGMVVLQAESEVASINMVYGAAGAGKKAMTSSSSPGVSLMQEGISYIAGAELPCLIVNVQRGGPGLGTIQPSQADYFQTTKGGGHGDYRLITLAPSSVQEMHDFVGLAFDLAFKYRNPAMILTDGALGQMMEKVELADQKPRRTQEELIRETGSWATTGKTSGRARNIITSLELDSEKMEQNNLRLQAKYKAIEENEIRYEEILCDDAEYLLVAFGTSSRICQKSIEILREKGDQGGPSAADHPLAFPLGSDCQPRQARKRHPDRGDECRTDGGRCEAGGLTMPAFVFPWNLPAAWGESFPSPGEVAEALENKFLKR